MTSATTAEITNGADSMEVDEVPHYESLAGREMISTFNDSSAGNESLAGREIISTFNDSSAGNENFAGREMINTLNNSSAGNPLFSMSITDRVFNSKLRYLEWP